MERPDGELTDAALRCLREAGRIASDVRRMAVGLVRPGVRVREVCEAVEDEIRRRGAGAAFPAQCSVNHVAAHYCPAPDDETTYAEGDLAKLDIGVHLDGWVVDTAQTVNVGGRPEGARLVQAAEAALEAAIAEAAPGVEVRRLSAAIEGTIRSSGLKPVRNLCGHGVGRWTVHRPPPVPNVPDMSSQRLQPESVIAVEPFATSGGGLVQEKGRAEVFRLDPARDRDGGPGEDRAHAQVMEALRAFRGLPFARRQLRGLPAAEVERALELLRRQRRLVDYPPLVETTGRPVAQAEHTLYVGTAGVLVLTR